MILERLVRLRNISIRHVTMRNEIQAHNQANSGCRTSAVVWQMVMLEGADGMISGTIEEYDFGSRKRWPQLRTYTNRQTRETVSRKM